MIKDEKKQCSKQQKMMLIVVVFRDDLHTRGDELRRVEIDTELTDHGNVSTRAQSLHEALDIER